VRAEVGIEDGRISRIARHLRGEDYLDADGGLVLPAAVDVHVHFRDPGQQDSEDWFSGSVAALAGGVCTVVDQPNTEPPTDSVDGWKTKMRVARGRAAVDFALNAGACNPDVAEELWRRGALAFGELAPGGTTATEPLGYERLKGVMESAAKLGATVTVHAEDPVVLAEVAAGNRGASDAADHSLLRPPEAELAAVRRVMADRPKELMVHFCHLTVPEAVQEVSGSPCSAEVACHHMFMDESDYARLGTLGVVNPPLRNGNARRGLWKAMRDGLVQVAVSDHAPHPLKEKRTEYPLTPPGLPGVETGFPLLLARCFAGDISLARVVESCCSNPARLFGLTGKGTLEPGVDADLVVVKPGKLRRITATGLHSKCGWTPYEGFEGCFPVHVLHRGETAIDAGEPVAVAGSGEWIPGKGYTRRRLPVRKLQG